MNRNNYCIYPNRYMWYINENIQKIAGILKKNKVVIKPSGKKHIKILIYRTLLLISKKKYE